MGSRRDETGRAAFRTVLLIVGVTLLGSRSIVEADEELSIGDSHEPTVLVRRDKVVGIAARVLQLAEARATEGFRQIGRHLEGVDAQTVVRQHNATACTLVGFHLCVNQVAVILTPAVAERRQVARPDPAPESTHVRTLDPVISRLIARGLERSATFRELVTAINGSDSYVYIKRGDCGAGVRTCFVAVIDSGSGRFLWVKVNSRKMDDSLVSLIGHELRHTIEVIQEPAVRNNSDLYFLYGRIGTHSTVGTIETRAAVDAGERVWKDMVVYERRDGR